MSEALLINSLKNELKTLKEDHHNLKIYIYDMENNYNNLKADYVKLKTTESLNMAKIERVGELESRLEKKDQEIFELKKEIMNIKSNYTHRLHEIECEYERDVNQEKYFNESNENKVKIAAKIENINKVISAENDKLVEVIKSFNEEQKKKIKEIELSYDNKMNEYKKKMIGYLKINSKNKLEISELENKIRGNLFVLKHDRLLEELEFQSTQLEDLLKQREHLDKIIICLKNDIQVHKKIEKHLTDKNIQYREMIKLLSNRRNDKFNNNSTQDIFTRNFNNTFLNLTSKNNNAMTLSPFTNKKDIDKINSDICTEIKCDKEEEKNTLDNTNIIKKYKEKYNVNSNKTSGKFNISDIKIQNNIFNKQTHFDKKNNLISIKIKRSSSSEIIDSTKKSNHNKNIELIHQIKEKTKMLENYKNKYDTIKDKLKMINDKYSRIISLFEEALNNIYNSGEIGNIKEIYSNLNEFSECDFSKLSPEKRYSVLLLIIKYILPLVNKSQISEVLKNTLNNINTKFYIKDDNESFSSRDTKYMFSPSTSVSNYNKTTYKINYNIVFKKKQKDYSTFNLNNKNRSCGELISKNTNNNNMMKIDFKNLKNKFGLYNKKNISNIRNICSSLVSSTEIDNVKKLPGL